jgi:hypothetical protein
MQLRAVSASLLHFRCYRYHCPPAASLCHFLPMECYSLHCLQTRRRSPYYPQCGVLLLLLLPRHDRGHDHPLHRHRASIQYHLQRKEKQGGGKEKKKMMMSEKTTTGECCESRRGGVKRVLAKRAPIRHCRCTRVSVCVCVGGGGRRLRGVAHSILSPSLFADHATTHSSSCLPHGCQSAQVP